MPLAHLMSFCLLSILTLAARWPIPRWALIVFLLAYGGTTEIAQSFLPPRSAEWTDWFQDIVGIAIGAVLCLDIWHGWGTAIRVREDSEC
jgi:VanZ family protein